MRLIFQVPHVSPWCKNFHLSKSFKSALASMLTILLLLVGTTMLQKYHKVK